MSCGLTQGTAIRFFLPDALNNIQQKGENMEELWTGRRRLEIPERPDMLPKMVPIYDHDSSGHPDSIRVSFEDGSTEIYDIRRVQPHPATVKSIEIIRKWNNGYNNQTMRRRRKP